MLSIDPLDIQRPRLRLGPGAAWFKVGDAPVVVIENRKPLRRLLFALASLRMETPHEVLSMPRAFEVGWPGERVDRWCARTRLYTAVHSLRRFGLRRILVRRAGGYTLDADITMVTDSVLPPPMPVLAPLAEQA